MKYSKKNKIALITGAGGLMGKYHAEALAEVGYNLVLIDLNIAKLLKLKKLLSKKFKKLKFYCFNCDITSEKQVKNLKKNLDENKLFISCLVNNADINPKMISSNSKIKSNFEDYKLDILKREISVGIFGTFNCSKLFGSAMAKKNDGIIINVSSDLGVIAPDQRIYDKSENILNVKNFKPISYSISKHALHGITKYLSTYWAHKKIRVNTLVMGAVFNNQSRTLVKNLQKRIPLGRMAKKNEYKKAIQFLANKENSYMTGQKLIVDGGRTIW
tara:strand:+ start:1946 stop:2764 length:819 start_codon:yes stop_codon:yes gene_type:complete